MSVILEKGFNVIYVYKEMRYIPKKEVFIASYEKQKYFYEKPKFKKPKFIKKGKFNFWSC